MARTILSINEIFGPTLQGEGTHIGKPTHFLRLAGCNLHCSWCDTPYAWDWQRYRSVDEAHPVEVETVIEKLSSYRSRFPYVTRLVVSGGEPMLQQPALLHVLREVNTWIWQIEIETNGTRAPLPELVEQVAQFNVSPKLMHSGHTPAQAIKGDVIEALRDTGKATWKFVVDTPADLREVDKIVTEHLLWPVIIMPLGITPTGLSDTAREIVDDVIARGWRLLPRLHVELFGNTRGV